VANKRTKPMGRLRVPVAKPGCAHGSLRDYDRVRDRAALRRGAEPDGTYCMDCARQGQYPQVSTIRSAALEARELPGGLHRLVCRTTLRYRCMNGHQWEEYVEVPASNPV